MCTSQSAPCNTIARSSQTGLVAGQTGFAGEPDEDPTNAQGKHTLGCPRLGRPARAPPHAMEMRDEQHIGLEEKGKKDKMCLIDVIGYSQSATTLYIYWVGWTYPARNLFYRSKSTKISNCTRTPLEPVRLVGLLLDRLQHQIGQTAWLDRSDWLRPILVVNSPDDTATDS